ncbi:hypothetical protein P9A16_32480 [Shinella sp. 838]|uniref:hypothetical protein n=1 Tax=Shinella sp. 838 TaxID=3038164 RepID=UPI002414FA06|nr:hypothetical protein [Shinella sp. 838]MDG4675820.1 hypothetical protein [Shinella sp. 838]
MTNAMKTNSAPWEGGRCRVPMWMGGSPSGFCAEEAFGPQYPRQYLAHKNPRYLLDNPPYCFGPCCPTHGGPKSDEPIIFQDGLTKTGRPMWCAVMPGFIDLQESEAGFSGNSVAAVDELRAAIAKAEGQA